MRYRKFHESFQGLRERSPIEEMRPGGRYLVIGDLHMGDGGATDELEALRGVVEEALASWYLKNGFTLVLNGDTEDLRNFWLKDIRSAWSSLYAIFDRFDSRGSLRKILGERDLGLLRKKKYRYQLLHGLRLLGKDLELFILHGHQASRYFAGWDYRDFVTSYLERPRRIRDDGDTEEPGRIYRAERRLYRRSIDQGIVTIFGHSGRRLFESQNEWEGIRSAIERLLLDSRSIYGENTDTMDAMIRLYRRKYREARKTSRVSIGLENGDEGFPAPCLFNPGMGAGRRGMNAIEIDDDRIRLVHWAKEKRLEKVLRESAQLIQSIGGSGTLRLVLAETDLASVAARISLVGTTD